MSENISVREWQKKYRNGDFDSKDRNVQCEAGWYDWFCRDDALAGRLKRISSVVMGITSPYILDNYYVWFKNNCPVSGSLYDDVRFEPLTGERDGKYFLVSLDSPYEDARWALYTERYGYNEPEFICGNVREMTGYLNNLAMELEQNITPQHVLMRKAAEQYFTQKYGPKSTYNMRRFSEHKFMVILPNTGEERNVFVSANMDDAPLDAHMEYAQEVNGLFVCPLDGDDIHDSRLRTKESTAPKRSKTLNDFTR